MSERSSFPRTLLPTLGLTVVLALMLTLPAPLPPRRRARPS